MDIIRILDDHIANQIAAGEVVERPSSVVKELVENGIDAGSSRIDVHIEEGGLQLIRVTDNGSGIQPEHCETAFQRHATSKIRSGRDLFQIRSLGFRGEALPSMAAVSRLQCLTAVDASGLGRKLIIEGGKLIEQGDAAASQGTDITVKDLFYNTPARLKYMKTIQTELGHVSDYMYRLALSRPNICFTLKHNEHVLLRTLGNGDMLQAIAAVYGTAAAKSMIPLDGQSLDYRIHGYVGKPELTRANRNGISMIVNGRYIRNFSLANALMHAYHTLLPIHRYPLAVIHLTMEPELIDVNVHPSKLEVRFSKEPELLRFLTDSVKEALEQRTFIPSGATAPAAKVKPAQIQEQLELYEVEKAQPVQSAPLPQPRKEAAVDPAAVRHFMAGLQAPEEKEERQSVASEGVTKDKKPVRLPKLYPIGQLRSTYIIAQNEEGLYLIDQHAAHERLNYEYYYEKFGRPEPVSQELLLPLTLEFTSAEAALLQERIVYFQQVGVYLEPFGGNAFKVTSYPHWLPSGEEKNIIEEMAEWVLQEKKAPDLAKLREKSSIMCSCKASIKANQSLGLAEMEQLLDRLQHARNPFTCPHGRPIVISFTNYELEKMFKRVM